MSNQDGQPTRPYWKRMHQDWRVWVAVFLMLVAMGIYVMTENLAWSPRGRNRRGSRQRSLDFLRTHPVENAPIPSETNPFSVKNESILDEKPLKKGSIWVRFSETNPPNFFTNFSRKFLMQCLFCNKYRRKTVGSFRRNTCFCVRSSPQ